jgi:integrase
MRGNITRRGRSSWRLKFDIEAAGGKRQTRYVTVRGKRQDAERELARRLNAAHDGTLVEPSKITIADYLRSWLDSPHGLAGKTAERYRQLADQQIIPHIGAVPLQKLRPAHVADWHGKLLTAGGMNGRALSARTVGHAHRVLHRALARAAAVELLPRNVASVVKPPKVEETEIEILQADQIATVLAALAGHMLEPIAVLDLSTGARRGEVLALRWRDLDLDGATVRIERSLEQTKAGLRFKAPKTKHGRRTVTLPSMAVEALWVHRRRILELRMALGQGKLDTDALVFSRLDGSPLPPNDLSRDWWRFVKSRKLPAVSFHALRHTHVSVLIASGMDVLAISRRIGHSSPVVTLRVYAHLFKSNDTAAATAIEAALGGNALRTGKER